MSRREVIPRPLRPPAKARQGILRIARVGKDAAEEVLEHVKHGRVSLNGGHGGGSDGGFTSMRAEPAGSKGWMRFYASKDDVTEQAREGAIRNKDTRIPATIESMFSLMFNTRLFVTSEVFEEIELKFMYKTTGDPRGLIPTEKIMQHGFSIAQIRRFMPSYFNLVLNEFTSTVPLAELVQAGLITDPPGPPPPPPPLPLVMLDLPPPPPMAMDLAELSPQAFNIGQIMMIGSPVLLHSPVRPLLPGSNSPVPVMPTFPASPIKRVPSLASLLAPSDTEMDGLCDMLVY